jgi:hypothetical protein
LTFEINNRAQKHRALIKMQKQDIQDFVIRNSTVYKAILDAAISLNRLIFEAERLEIPIGIEVLHSETYKTDFISFYDQDERITELLNGSRNDSDKNFV